MNLADRFWNKVNVVDGDDCWTWTAHRDTHGYGRIGSDIRKRTLLAHRVSYAIANGIDPHTLTPDTVIRHSCDNPSCVNPAHLDAGTQAQNVADMVNRGRTRNRNQFVDGRCIAGHDITDPADQYIESNGARHCRTCTLLRARAYHAKKRQQQIDLDKRLNPETNTQQEKEGATP